MYHIDFMKPCHVHFIGIGGISMSGFAELLHSYGFTISGSDQSSNNVTKHLESLGITVRFGQRAANITDDIDVVVYTAAIHEDNEELQAARAKNLPCLTRGEMIGQCTTNYANTIAISGTHGKTTTTSMMTHILLEANLDPTISVGGMLNAIHGNIRIGKSEHFLTEACEYTNSFLNFNPKRAVILNIDADHLDFFKDLDDIRNSFHLFGKRLTKDGQLFINGDIPNLSEITGDLICEVYTFGMVVNEADVSKYDYTACHVTYNELGYGSFDMYYRGTPVGHFKLRVPGAHNVLNSLSVIGIAHQMKLSTEVIQNALSNFDGVGRRFEYKGEVGGISIYDDYAHHPTEITATLTAAQKFPHKTVWCVFQPHTYTRTHALLHEFATALSHADKVVLADIYAARETNTLGVSSEDIKKLLEDMGKEVYYFPSFDEIETFLLQNCMNGDMLITMGAGDIVKVGESLLGK